ncbi:MAG: SMI1/KNR4 family protein [Verrucomicrobiales bacterium]
MIDPLEGRTAAIEKQLGLKIPRCLVNVWRSREFESGDGVLINEYVFLFGTTEIVERNTTFGASKYCPGFLAIASDSGDEMAFLDVHRETCNVYLNYITNMRSESMHDTGLSFNDWIKHPYPFAREEIVDESTGFSAVRDVIVILTNSNNLSHLMKIRKALNLDISISDLQKQDLPYDLKKMGHFAAVKIVETIGFPTSEMLSIIDFKTRAPLPSSSDKIKWTTV